MTIPEALDARISSLLTSDVKSWKLIGVSKEIIGDTLKSLNNVPKVLARRSNANLGYFLPTEQESKQLAGSVLATAAVRLQTE